MPMVQEPPTHVFDALAKLHTFPHVPQLLTFVAVSISQPFASMLSQFWNEPSQAAMAHVPFMHASVALANVQGELQAPQCITSVCTFVSQPLGFMASQF